MINAERLEKLFMDLCRIHGEPKKESLIAEFLTNYFESRGYTVERDSAHTKYGGSCGNLFVRIPGSLPGPTLMLSAHMDTVITGGPVVPVREGEYIRSKGDTILGSDDKAGIAAILEVLQTVSEKSLPHLPLLIAFTSAEEIGLLGAKYCELTIEDADMGVVLDTSGPIGKIVNIAPFHESYEITVRGKSAHAGIEPEKGVNAIQHASKLIVALPTGRISEDTTANIAQIHGGVANNIVPELVTIKGEIRSCSESNLLKLLSEIETACTNFDSKATIEFSSHREYDGYSLDTEAEVIKRLTQAAESIGKEPYTTHTGGGSDANFFNQKGIPTAVISCGMAKVHTYDEEILVSDLIDTARMTLALVTVK